MNVWIVNHDAIPPSLGGLVRHYYFSKYLQKKGHNVRIITSSKIHNSNVNFIKDKRLYLEKEVDGVEYTFVRSSDYSGNGLDRIFNMMGFPFNVRKTMEKLRKIEQPDIIYTSSPDMFVPFFALLFGKKKKIPVVFEIRDLWPESIVEYNEISKKNPIIRVLYQMEKWMYKKSEALIFTMQGGRQYIQDKGWDKSIDLKKVYHVNNGVDIEEFDANVQKWELEDDDLQNDSKFKVIYVGSVRKANNVNTLVEVAKVFDSLGEEDIQFLVYGDGTEREILVKKCETLGLVNIKFKGRVDKKYVPYILSKSNLNILNYKQSSTWKYGGSQNKQFEYLASGTPICANVKMGYSIIMSNHCGVEENIDNIERYVEIIQNYKRMSKEEYETQCAGARQASLQYDYEVLGRKIEKILQTVIGQ